MELSFAKLSPTQNVTILVETLVPRQNQPALAAKLLAADCVGGEQVGFLEPPTLPGARIRLQMMGGEFCGNASMSVGAYLASRDGLRDGETAAMMLEVSGADSLVPCSVTRVGDAFQGTVEMPLPQRFGKAMLPCDRGEVILPMAVLPGIVHLIAEEGSGLTREEIERRIREWNDIVHADALGVLMWNEEERRMTPIVYVPASDTAVWERGCGSGSAALGSWLAWRDGESRSIDIRQPGGEIQVDARVRDDRISRLTITGMVRLTARGIAYV